MATWNVGPFDNDEAVEWCDRFHLTDPDRRIAFVEGTLADAADRGDELTEASCSEVVAAATVVLQAQVGAVVPTTPYAPVSPVDPISITATPRLIGLARAALEVILREDSTFRRKWAGDVEEDLALEAVQRLHRVLTNRKS
jgi:hypothetical protein